MLVSNSRDALPLCRHETAKSAAGKCSARAELREQGVEEGDMRRCLYGNCAEGMLLWSR